MKLIPILAAAASIFAASSASAALVTLNFEDIPNTVSVIGDFPIGSFDNSVVFANDAGDNKAMIVNTVTAPSSVFNAGAGGGFLDSLSLAYFNVSGSNGTVSIWSGLNGGGTQLASLTLGDNSASADVQLLNTWTLASTNFTGLAQSIVFSGNDGYIAYDNVTVNAVPLPAALLLFPMGAAGLGLTARRKRKQA
jgi:hypothetical protein